MTGTNHVVTLLACFCITSATGPKVLS